MNQAKFELTDLQQEVHQNAIDHGWWDEDRTFGELIALCHSELSEALEEHRNGLKSNLTYYKCKDKDSCQNYYKCEECRFGKPEGIPTELADVVIRILDLFGRYNCDVQKMINEGRIFRAEDRSYDNFGEFIGLCHRYLSYAQKSYQEWLVGLILEIREFCDKEDIDLEATMIQKHRFNQTRPYKHGGKVI